MMSMFSPAIPLSNSVVALIFFFLMNVGARLAVLTAPSHYWHFSALVEVLGTAPRLRARIAP